MRVASPAVFSPVIRFSGFQSLRSQPFDTVPDTVLFGGRVKPNLTEKQARAFLRKHVPPIQRMTLAAYNLAWAGLCQGGEYKEPGQDLTNSQREQAAETALKNYFNQPEALKELKALLAAKGQITDRLLVRQLDKLYESFEDAGKSVELLALETQLNDRTTELTGLYNKYRGSVDGQVLANSAVMQQQLETNDPVLSQKLWRAVSSHGLMPVKAESGETRLAQELVSLVKLRNDVARRNVDKNGKSYSDFYSMRLDQQEIDEDLLVRLLDQTDEATREAYAKNRAAITKFSEQRYGISSEEARLPWFGAGNLQRILSFDLKPYLTGKDPLVLLEKTANAMGETLQSIVEKSTYVRDGQTRSGIYFDAAVDQGKSQHWFSVGINPPFDVRTFGSVDPKHQDVMDFAVQVLLHEMTGHGLDSLNVSSRLPVLLRRHHPVTTESHAMLLENLGKDARWLEKIVGVPQKEAQELARKAILFDKAVLIDEARRTVAMIQFERQMYKNPDQDLNKLWWDLQEKYRMIKRPDDADQLPEFARIVHMFSHPVYFQNYFLAELVRAQKLEYISENFGSLLSKEAGEYLRTFRKTGLRYDWSDLVERMTGKPLGLEAFKKEFAGFSL